MFVEALRLLLVVGLLVVLPGWLLINALFPAHRLRGVERAYLVAASGVLLVISVGLVLGFLPHGREGHFSTLASGAPNVEAAMLVVALALFWVGLHRGAYPAIARRFPQLAGAGAR